MTLGVYAAGTTATAFANDFLTFALFQFLTGAGIGGEYAAINSAIQEFIPARYRGRTDLAINGSFWLGAMLGSLASAVLLVPGRLPADVGWRAAFAIGGILSLVVLAFRRTLPESPRWLIVHGRVSEAEQIVVRIEQAAGATTDGAGLPRLRLHASRRINSFVDLAVSLFQHYPRRAVLGLVLMAAQAFFYNAIFFTYALVLSRFYAVPGESIGLYLLPFAICNFMGPLALGWLFDSWGRRPMIAATYALSGVLLGATALLFVTGQLNALTLTIAFSIVFFFASVAASSAYLTVSECFPLEVRALAIAVFYALGTALGGIAAPWVFGALICAGDPRSVAGGYTFAAALMIGAALVELWVGVTAECRALEDVAPPLSSA